MMKSCKIAKLFMIFFIVMFLLVMLTCEMLCTNTGHSKAYAAEAAISQLKTALDMYRLDTDRYPTTTEGLEALMTAPVASENWQGPYLKRKRLPKDAWGNSYQYVFPSRHPGLSYDIYSLGADGHSRTQGDDPDDINNWTADQPWQKHYSRSRNARDIAALTILFLFLGGFIGMMVSLTLCWIHLLFVWRRQRKKSHRHRSTQNIANKD